MGSGPVEPEDSTQDAFDPIWGTRSEISGDVHGFSIQARDIRGDVHVHQAAAQTPPPSQLPAAVRLTGRVADLTAMDSARASRLIVITGPPGIGKTSLAVTWGHRVRADFPDGVLYEDLHGYAPDGPGRPAESLGRFLRAFGVAPHHVPAELAELTNSYRSLSIDKRILVVLDDALTAAQIVPLLPSSPESLTIITSRKRLGALVSRGARIVQLGKLQPEDALDLLKGMLGEERTARERRAAQDLVELCGRVPLALCVAAARLAARSRWEIGEMVDALRQERQRLAVLTLEEDIAVHSSLEISYQGLHQRAARMYRVMGLYPGTRFESGIAAAASFVPRAEAKQLLGTLADANLIDDDEGGRYLFYDLTRIHASEKAEQEESGAERAIVIRRTLDWFLTAATIAGQSLTPYRHDQPRDVVYQPAEPPRFASPRSALDWLDRELPEVMAVARFAAEQGEPKVTWQLADAMWPVFRYRGHHTERLEFDLMGLAAARVANDRLGVAKMLYRLGLAFLDLKRLDEADSTLRQALAAWDATGNAGRVAGCWRRLGLIAVARGHHDEAIEHFGRALDAYRQQGDSRHVALALSDLGSAFTAIGQAHDATASLNEASALLGRDADPYNRALLLIRLGQAHEQAGQLEAAAEHLTEALRSMRSIGSDRGEAQALMSLGHLAEITRRPVVARDHYMQAQNILLRLGSPQAGAVTEKIERLAGSGEA